MKWIKFKDEMPKFKQPIFVYRRKGGVYDFFTKDDDIRRCWYSKKTEDDEDIYYYLYGYAYGECRHVPFSKKELSNMSWMPIPTPPK